MSRGHQQARTAFDIMGTKGEIRGAMDSSENPITCYDFETKKTEAIPMKVGDGITNGHGGGDEGIVESFYEYLNGSYTGPSVSEISVSVDNHLIVFAAEKSRSEGSVVDLEEYRNTLLEK